MNGLHTNCCISVAVEYLLSVHVIQIQNKMLLVTQQLDCAKFCTYSPRQAMGKPVKPFEAFGFW